MENPLTDAPSPATPDARSRPSTKWGAAAVTGWQALPDVLLKNQAALGLSAVDMVVLINLLSYWWFVEHKPFPRASLIARRMNVSPRTVQRSIQRLVDRGLLAHRVEVGPDGDERAVLDPEGLVHRLEKLARHDPIYVLRSERRGLNEAEAPF